MIPSFLPDGALKRQFKPQEMALMFLVDGVQPASFLASARATHGRGVKGYTDKGGGATRYRPIDLIAYAQAHGYVVGPPKPRELRATWSQEDRLEHHREVSSLKMELAGLRSDLAREKHRLSMCDASVLLTGNTLLDHSEIVGGSMPKIFCCGVYFLIRERIVIYVGQSVNVHARIAVHAESKVFDSIAVIECAKSELNILESLYIHTLRPEANGQYESRGKSYVSAPIGLKTILKLCRGEGSQRGQELSSALTPPALSSAAPVHSAKPSSTVPSTSPKVEARSRQAERESGAEAEAPAAAAASWRRSPTEALRSRARRFDDSSRSSVST